MNLLAALCQGSFVGDTAVTLATSIISLLRQISEEKTEQFVKRILRTKIIIYSMSLATKSGSFIFVASKGRKLSDLLRDNR
jgi:hypothetical protein